MQSSDMTKVSTLLSSVVAITAEAFTSVGKDDGEVSSLQVAKQVNIQIFQKNMLYFLYFLRYLVYTNR